MIVCVWAVCVCEAEFSTVCALQYPPCLLVLRDTILSAPVKSNLTDPIFSPDFAMMELALEESDGFSRTRRDPGVNGFSYRERT